MNWWRLFLAVCFYIGQNSYFGWNALPMSDAELIADGMVYLMLVMAIKEAKP